jgi:hypothetical protein
MKITRKNFWPEGVVLPPVALLDAFKKMLDYLQSGEPVKYTCWTIDNLVDKATANEFVDYITDIYLRPNARTNNFYNFYRALYLQETGTECFGENVDKQATELRIEWLKAAIKNIELRTKINVKRAVKLSDTKVYKTLKKALADDPSEFQKVYVGLKWAWDSYAERHPGVNRNGAFSRTLMHIANWGDMPVGDFDYWYHIYSKAYDKKH